VEKNNGQNNAERVDYGSRMVRSVPRKRGKIKDSREGNREITWGGHIGLEHRGIGTTKLGEERTL